MFVKVAIVTGGSRGLGKAIALNIAEKGQDVILTYKSKKPEAEEVVALIEKSGRKAIALQLDASNVTSFIAFREEVKDTLKQTWKRDTFDFLVNNAGFGVPALFAETTEDQFDQLVNVH